MSIAPTPKIPSCRERLGILLLILLCAILPHANGQTPAGTPFKLPTEIALPVKVYATVGAPMDIYFDNLVYCPIKNLLLMNESSGPGSQLNDRISWTPADHETGSKKISIAIHSGLDFSLLAENSLDVVVCNPGEIRASGKIKWLAIGDSLTLNGQYIHRVAELFSTKIPSVEIESLGTQHPPVPLGSVMHEARGGWTWLKYLTAFSPAGQARSAPGSPFVFGGDSEKSFDFKRYILERGQANWPDVVTIFLGANDVFGIAENFSESKVDQILGHAESMIAKIKLASPKTIIGVISPPPPSDQTAFGINYGSGVTEWQYRRALQAYTAKLQKALSSRESEGIYYVPCHLGFNSETLYPRDATGRNINALHFKNEGGDVLGNELFAWFAYLLKNQNLQPHS